MKRACLAQLMVHEGIRNTSVALDVDPDGTDHVHSSETGCIAISVSEYRRIKKKLHGYNIPECQ